MSGEALKPGDKVWVLAEVTQVQRHWFGAVPVMDKGPEVSVHLVSTDWRRDPLPDADAAYERGRAEATKAAADYLHAAGIELHARIIERGDHLAGKVKP